jgi:hypothetical protein
VPGYGGSTVSIVEATGGAVAVPEPGRLVRVRGRHWVVADVTRSVLTLPPQHFVSLTSVEDNRYDESIDVLWEIEPGTRVLERATLPTPDSEHFDDPERLAAFLDAIRWGRGYQCKTPRHYRRRSGPASRSRTTSSIRWFAQCAFLG